MERRSVVAANSLLAALPRKDYPHLLPSPGPIRHVYFPNDFPVSLLAPVDDRLVVSVGSAAKAWSASRFRREFPRCASQQRELHRYAHALMTEVRQTAACNRFHAIEARLARRLLMTRDWLRSDRFRITQEFLPHMRGYAGSASPRSRTRTGNRVVLLQRTRQESESGSTGSEAVTSVLDRHAVGGQRVDTDARQKNVVGSICHAFNTDDRCPGFDGTENRRK